MRALIRSSSLVAALAALLWAQGAVVVDGAQARAPKAPGGPPLLAPGSPSAIAGEDLGIGAATSPAQESSGSGAPSGGDVLAANGLGSPLCGDSGGLDTASRHNCQTSGFIAASAPTGNYAFDVNIDTGIGNLSNSASAIVLDFAEQGWMGLVAITHALVVMFEWCFSLSLLGGAVMSQVTRALHSARLSVTEPWMAFALALAAALAVHQGLVRRRVADTVGQALATIAMMVGGLWVVGDPAGTVGALQRWADEGAAGTLAVAAGGEQRRSHATLAANMDELFGAVIVGPWCYLEFGDVGWCENRSRLDPHLRRVALSMVKQPNGGCRASCKADSGAQALSARLVRAAHTNGELFLALPANEVQRNSTKEHGTLLNALCGGGPSADDCRGPTAPQAQFRSERGLDNRLMGLASIWLGALGMLLVFGVLAVRLLVAAVSTLLYLLLAPAMVLAPVLGDAGRSLFMAWTTRLLAACVSKLTYAFLLGVLLTVNRMLLSVTALGWWAQWCLLSAFWWTAFSKRHAALAVLGGRQTPLFFATPRSRRIGWRELEALEVVRAARRVASKRLRARQRPTEVLRPRRLPPSAKRPMEAPPKSEPPKSDLPESDRRKSDLPDHEPATPPARVARPVGSGSSPLGEDIRAWARSYER
ncbi:MAG: hypothetical protein ACTHM1_00050 [Solirubrobacteraceae bacterium]